MPPHGMLSVLRGSSPSGAPRHLPHQREARGGSALGSPYQGPKGGHPVDAPVELSAKQTEG